MSSQVSSGRWSSHAGFFPIPKEEVRTEVQKFAKKANRLADQILSENSPTPYTGPVIIRNNYYYGSCWSPWFWYTPHTVYVPQQSRRERESDNNFLIGLFAAIVGGIALYAIGSGMSQCEDAHRELEKTHEFQNKLKNFQRNGPAEEQRYVAKAAQTASLKERICSRIKNSAITDLFLRTVLFVGCGLALTGALAFPPLVLPGVVIAIVGVGGMLFKWGLESSNSQNILDAKAPSLSYLFSKQMWRRL